MLAAPDEAPQLELINGRARRHAIGVVHQDGADVD
jgi:hypothetical protein